MIVIPRRGGLASDLRTMHTPAAIRERLGAGPDQSYLRDLVYGAIDGAVTTLAVVSGVAGAGLSPGLVIVLGAANVVADGFSMGVSNFLATRAEQQEGERARKSEESHIASFPEGEREEIRQIFAQKGFAGDDLERAVSIITSDGRLWVDTMLREELGLTLTARLPARAAFATFAAFLAVGLVPLMPFIVHAWVFSLPLSPFMASAVATAVAFFGVGAFKGRFVGQRWYTSGLETLAVGGSAASLAYLVGMLLNGLVRAG